MADKENDNDEYQFTETDVLNPEVVSKEDNGPPSLSSSGLSGTQIKRNALIVVVVFVVAMILYKFMGAYFSEKKSISNKKKVQIAPVSKIIQQPKVQIKPIKTEIATRDAPSANNENTINRKMATLQLSQENTRSDVATLSSQVSGMSGSMSSLSNSVAELNTLVSSLNNKLESQSSEIDKLSAQIARAKKAKTPHHVERRPELKYYIQAVIPGRAWLISSTGQTITVREGSSVRGYGEIKLIDSMQSKIITSSGKVIRFASDGS